MTATIPDLAFRIDPAYEFEGKLVAPELDGDNVIVGQLPASSSVDAVFLGKLAEHQASRRNVWLDSEGAHAIYVMGKRRSGKTYTLGVIAEGLVSNNWIKQGSRRQPVLLLDTMNVFATMHYSVESVYGVSSAQGAEFRKWGLEDEPFEVVLFYPRGTEAPPEGNIKEVAIRPADLTAEDWAAFFGVDTYSDPIGQLISELYEKVVLEGYTDQYQNQVSPKSNYTIEDILGCTEACPAIQRYPVSTIEAVRRRMNAVRRLQIFSDQAIPIEQIFRPGQISIFLLRDIDQGLRSLLVAVLVKKIMERRSTADRYERLAAVQLASHETLRQKDLGRAKDAQEKYVAYLEQAKAGLPRGWVIIDEAHNYMPSRGISPSSVPLKKYVNEGRNLGLSIVVATQSPSALDHAIRRNADVIIIHSMSMKDDITTAEGMINTTIPDEYAVGRMKLATRTFEHLVRSLPIGYAVISNDRADRVFVTRMRPRITIHGGVEY